MSTGVLPAVYTKPNIIKSDDGINMPINEEYTISGSGAAAKIILKKQVGPGNKISFTVLKPKIGTKA